MRASRPPTPSASSRSVILGVAAATRIGSVNVLVTVLVVLAVVAVAICVVLLVRRHAPADGFFIDGDRAAGVFGVLATGFSVLLGFLVFLAFTSYDTARAGARTEATTLIQQYETAQLLPQPASARLSGELICYGRAVVGVEWPLLQAGQKPSFNPWGIELFRTLQTVTPTTAVAQAAYAKWLDQTSDREQARLDRVQAGSGVIPGPLWLILFVSGGARLRLHRSFFADRARRHQLAAGCDRGTIAAMLVDEPARDPFPQPPVHAGLRQPQADRHDARARADRPGEPAARDPPGGPVRRSRTARVTVRRRTRGPSRGRAPRSARGSRARPTPRSSCAPAPRGPKSTVGMPASASRAASVQDAMPAKTTGRPAGRKVAGSGSLLDRSRERAAPNVAPASAPVPATSMASSSSTFAARLARRQGGRSARGAGSGSGG